jgi:type 1 glutamine amidotransferase
MFTQIVRTLVAICLSLALSIAQAAKPAETGAKLHLLILSGANNHDWKATTPVLKKLYEESGRFTVDVSENVPALTGDDFAKYDVLVCNYTTYPKIAGHRWPAKTEKAFLDYIAAGHGFVLFHAASTAWADWPEFGDLIGLTWQVDKTTGKNISGHGSQHSFFVTITDRNHPVTKGMKDFQHATDELYHRQLLHPGAHVLATAFSSPAKGGSGKDEPMAVVTEHGKGRVFHCAMGHHTSAMAGAGFQTLMLRGAEWAATGKVTLPIPAALQAVAASNQRDAIVADMQFFTDSSCSQLKPGIKAKDLADFKSDLLKSVAAKLLNGAYDKTYRAASYEAYPSSRELARTLKLGNNFSRYENITGMYLEAGENVVFMGNTGGKRLSLLIPDWMRKPPAGVQATKDPNGWGLKKQRLPLQEGLNIVQVDKSGNAYVSYFDDHAAEAPKVCVHFPTGKVNGFFDVAKHTDADWDRLLDQAVSPVLDARGKHIQVAYPVEWFNKYTRGKGVELINDYDTLLHHHYSFMGLVKYNKVPKNRMLARVNFNYYMFRDGDGVAYLGNRGTMRMVADPSVVIKGDPCWGFCHETGHALQMRQITWGGMTEVSNNLFSLYTGGQMGNKSRLKAQHNYASARKNIIQAKPRKSLLDGTDVFDRLVPLWQLHLYFSRHGRPDFYADVMEEMRRRPDAGSGSDSIRNQLEFTKICCDVAKLDLTDFFDQWGFYWVGDLDVGDYGSYHYKITRQMVDEVKSDIAKKHYSKPAEDVTRTED